MGAAASSFLIGKTGARPHRLSIEAEVPCTATFRTVTLHEDFTVTFENVQCLLVFGVLKQRSSTLPLLGGRGAGGVGSSATPSGAAPGATPTAAAGGAGSSEAAAGDPATGATGGGEDDGGAPGDGAGDAASVSATVGHRRDGPKAEPVPFVALMLVGGGGHGKAAVPVEPVIHVFNARTLRSVVCE